jgi:thiamine pyrophosphate-dependent acetolactate synthase large subunit-like protein
MLVSVALLRRPAVAKILSGRGEALIVTGLGNSSYDVAAAGDHAHTFYLWGAMGGAAMVGLGLALAQPQRRVLVITGDGEMLMGLGSLATIAAERPENLAIAVLDNEHYGETGMQPTHTGRGVSLAGIAREAGFVETATVRDEAGLTSLCERLFTVPGPLFGVIKVATAPAPTALPPRDGPYIRSRFRTALLGVEAHR